MRSRPALMAILALLALCGILPGCNNDKVELSRYPKVAVPGYAAKDYYLSLYDKNDEIVYNAICNLVEDAGSIASTLSDKKADKRSPRFVLASLTYKRIVELLQSGNEDIVSAALRFLQIFGPSYDKKEDLVGPVLKARSRGRNARFERVAALSAIAAKDSPVSDAFLERSLKDPCWLVSRAAYSLVNSLENDRMRTKLIRRYKSTNTEYEKLLILTSMNNGLSSGVFAFLSKEALDSRNEKIRGQTLRHLANATNTAEVLQWVNKNYERLSPADIKKIDICTSIDHDFSSSLYGIFIRKGWPPDDDFFKELYEKTAAIDEGTEGKELSIDDVRHRNNIKNLEKVVMANKPAADGWEAYKRKKEIFTKSAYSEIRTEYDTVVKEFSGNLTILLDKHTADPDKKKGFIDLLPSFFTSLFEELIKAMSQEKV